jgi:hypothetical protein
MKKTILTSVLALISSWSVLGQTTQVDLYTGSTNNMLKSFDTQLNNTNGYARMEDSDTTTSTTSNCTVGSQLILNYSSATDAYWAGNGGFNINNWGFGTVQNYSSHTHLKVSFKWVASSHSTANTLVFSFMDSTVATPAPNLTYKSGNDVVVANATSSACSTKYIPLSSFVGAGGSGKDINLSNLQGITWKIDGIQWNATAGLQGACDGTVYLDDIKVLDLTAPTITGFSVGSGAVGDSIDLTGTNFKHVETITFNGSATSTTGFRILNSTTIRVKIPSGATTGTITAANPVNSGTSSGSFSIVLGLEDKVIADVTVGPNPTNSIVTINTKAFVDQVLVTDCMGSVVYDGNQTSVNLSNVPQGIYFVTVISGDRKTTKKVVKQ